MIQTQPFDLNEEQGMLLETARQVAAAAGAQALDRDEHRQFAEEGWAQLGETGLLGVLPSAEDGGAGLGMVAFALTLETLAESDAATARLLLSQGGACAAALAGIAPSALGEVLQGRLAAFVGPAAGVRATPAAEGFVLDGRCEVATAAARAELLVVAARLGDEPALFVVAPTLAACAPVPAAGFRATAPGSVTFTAAHVGADALAARGPAAAEALARADRAMLIGGGAIAVGMAFASCALARRHAHERIAFGKPLFQQQAVRHKLVEALRRTQAARHLVWHAARLADARSDAALAAAMVARLAAVEAAVYSADEGIQIHGGFGYVVEYHVERHYRDALSLSALDRGSESLRDALGATLAL